MTADANLKQLLNCSACDRQYDVAGMDVGDRFHCSCGEVLSASSVDIRDSAVVRCSACGGARTGQEPKCNYCQADFTVHERDLVAICPGCAVRLPRAARYCHGCGIAIDLSASKPGGPSDRGCPACADGTLLRSRRLGDVGAAGTEGAAERRLGSVLECPHCAGLWIGSDAFGRLEVEAKRTATLDAGLQQSPIPPPPKPTATNAGSAALQSGPRSKSSDRLYRECVVCGHLMNRRNYARRSGVILDVCRDHGIWFDEKELESILEWIRRGGWEREEQRRTREAAEAERAARRRAASVAPAPVVQYGGSWLDGLWFFAVVAEILESVFDL